MIKGDKIPHLPKYQYTHTHEHTHAQTCTLQEARVVTESIDQFRSMHLTVYLKLVIPEKDPILEFFMKA